MIDITTKLREWTGLSKACLSNLPNHIRRHFIPDSKGQWLLFGCQLRRFLSFDFSWKRLQSWCTCKIFLCNTLVILFSSSSKASTNGCGNGNFSGFLSKLLMKDGITLYPLIVASLIFRSLNIQDQLAAWMVAHFILQLSSMRCQFYGISQSNGCSWPIYICSCLESARSRHPHDKMTPNFCPKIWGLKYMYSASWESRSDERIHQTKS